MAGFQAPIGGWFYPTSNDARYATGDSRSANAVIVHYPLHPFYGRGELPVCRRRGIGNVEHVEVEIDQRQQAVPIWMTDHRICQLLTISLSPHASLTALLELHSLLEASDL